MCACARECLPSQCTLCALALLVGLLALDAMPLDPAFHSSELGLALDGNLLWCVLLISWAIGVAISLRFLFCKALCFTVRSRLRLVGAVIALLVISAGIVGGTLVFLPSWNLGWVVPSNLFPSTECYPSYR